MGGHKTITAGGENVPTIPPPTAPVPVSAVWTVGASRLDVTFDSPLQNGSYASSQHFIRVGNIERFIQGSVTVSGGVAFMWTSPGTGNPGPDVTSYSPPPFSLIGTNSVLVEAYSNFPIT